MASNLAAMNDRQFGLPGIDTPLPQRDVAYYVEIMCSARVRSIRPGWTTELPLVFGVVVVVVVVMIIVVMMVMVIIVVMMVMMIMVVMMVIVSEFHIWVCSSLIMVTRPVGDPQKRGSIGNGIKQLAK